MAETITLLPISGIIPTRNRVETLYKCLQTFGAQRYQPEEIIIIDGSERDDTQKMLERELPGLKSRIVFLRALKLGAAAQRNQGVLNSSFDFVLFADDDVYLEPDCIYRLWKGINGRPDVGGVSAMITNQKYVRMGTLSTIVATMLNGGRLNSFAGKCLVPGWGMLPEDRDDLPEYTSVEWLNLGATLYRKTALPVPVFPDNFSGYSLMEDLALSVTVGRNLNLLNARTARIFHDSQPGSHKSNIFKLAEMDTINRYFIMTRILRRTGIGDHLRFLLFQLFQVAGNMTTLSGLRSLPAFLSGKFLGLFKIVFLKQSV